MTEPKNLGEIFDQTIGNCCDPTINTIRECFDCNSTTCIIKEFKIKIRDLLKREMKTVDKELKIHNRCSIKPELEPLYNYALGNRFIIEKLGKGVLE